MKIISRKFWGLLALPFAICSLLEQAWAKPLLTLEDLLPDKPALPAGKGGLDVVLLRVPMATASAALLNPNMDELLPAILKDPETSVVTRASVEGWRKKELALKTDVYGSAKEMSFSEVKWFEYVDLGHFAKRWEYNQACREAGEKITDEEGIQSVGHRAPETSMSVRMEKHQDRFAMEVYFSWTPEPVKRPFTMWPVKQLGAGFIPMFQPWEFAGRFVLTSDAISLLAAHPGSTDANGKGVHTGFMLMAFGKARRVAEQNKPREMAFSTKAHPCHLRSWTIEVPLAEGEKMLRNRQDHSGDPTLLTSMLGMPDTACISGSLMSFVEWERPWEPLPFDLFYDSPPAENFRVARSKSDDPFAADYSAGNPVGGGSVLFSPDFAITERFSNTRFSLQSKLSFDAPIHCFPSWTKEMRIVCRDFDPCELENTVQLEMMSTGGSLGVSVAAAFPTTPLRWEKWHGSTLGAKDEPVGMETAILGQEEWKGILHLPAGVGRLAWARQVGEKLRLTFFRWDRSGVWTSSQPIPSTFETVRILETPSEPWFHRLAQPHEESLVSDLNKALDSGKAILVQIATQEVSLRVRSMLKTETGYLSQENFLNTFIQGDHLYYSPIDARSRSTEMILDSWGVELDEVKSKARQGITLTEVVGKQRYAMWIPRSPLHTRATSGIERPIIGSTSWQASVTIADGKDQLMGTCVLPANSFRKEPVIRWFISSITGDTKYYPLGAAVPEWVEFTVLATDAPVQTEEEAIRPNLPGKLLAQGMVSVGGNAQVSAGLNWDTPEPRAKVHSKDPAPKEIPPGTIFNNQTTLVTTFCGLKAELRYGKWDVTYRPDPEISVDTLDYYEGGDIPQGGAKKPPIPISCERALYEKPSTAEGTLPALGKQISVSLGASRLLIVRRLPR